MNLKKNHYSRRALALLLTLAMCVGMIPTAFAAQQNSYHDPAEHWMQVSGRTNELDANSVVTRETFKCGECGKATSFEVFRVPEYTRNGQPALSRNVKYSDGTMVDGVGKGDTMDGIPGKDATYTGYHYTKAVCETCGGINTNMSKSEYGYLKNVYWLYDCAAAFTQELDETVSYEYTDDTYHTVTTKGGTYCAFCYGTNHTVSRKLERHSMVTEVLPQPANGRFATVEKGPFIVITGHDLHDLKLLLEQTEGKGVNIYTHGEMLPAHGYPELKKYPHLKGNFGTAWQNQQKEFADIPAPVLFTTNCLMPPRASYADRVFTTAVVSYPELTHIGEDKDFTPVIEKALELGGYNEDKPFTGINGGGTVMTGFGHGAVLGVADQVIEAVKSGAIRHFFLVGGCDGARPGRNYYTEFVNQTPADTVVLTLACGKYRFNDLDLGTIGGLPRLMDVGQCNDAYGAVKIALALAEAFDCGVNDLPLSLVLSWYEQKAVCILLTLLYLGIKNIRLGPTLPAFVSPNVLNYLVENFGIAPITTPEEDLKQLLK